MNDTERQGLYTTEELGCEPPQADTSNPGGTLSTEEADRLIDQYRREAGTLGPGKWFSAAKLGFHFGVAVAYDDNIRTSIGSNKEGDEITTLTGGVTVSLGDFVARQNSFLIFDYALTENIFATYGDEDALDQDGLLNVRYRMDRFSVESLSHFQALHDPTADTGERERRYVYDEVVTFQYRYGDKTTLGAQLSYDRTDASLGDSHQQYTLETSADYLAFDKITLGLGLVVGRLEGDGGLSETFEEALARFEYQVTGKISVLAQGGIDIRERGSEAGDDATPVFRLEGRWTPYDGTTLTLGGFRRVEASESIEGEDYTDTAVQLDLRQRFFGRYYLLASASYTHSDYKNVTGSALPPRTDNAYYVRAGADYEAIKFFDVGLFYQREQTDSTLKTYSYASNRVSLQSHFVY